MAVVPQCSVKLLAKQPWHLLFCRTGVFFNIRNRQYIQLGCNSHKWYPDKCSPRPWKGEITDPTGLRWHGFGVLLIITAYVCLLICSDSDSTRRRPGRMTFLVLWGGYSLCPNSSTPFWEFPIELPRMTSLSHIQRCEA